MANPTLSPVSKPTQATVVSIIDSESNLASQAAAWISPETMECVAQLMEEQNAPSRQVLSASGGTKSSQHKAMSCPSEPTTVNDSS